MSILDNLMQTLDPDQSLGKELEDDWSLFDIEQDKNLNSDLD